MFWFIFPLRHLQLFTVHVLQAAQGSGVVWLATTWYLQMNISPFEYWFTEYWILFSYTPPEPGPPYISAKCESFTRYRTKKGCWIEFTQFDPNRCIFTRWSHKIDCSDCIGVDGNLFYLCVQGHSEILSKVKEHKKSNFLPKKIVFSATLGQEFATDLIQVNHNPQKLAPPMCFQAAWGRPLTLRLCAKTRNACLSEQGENLPVEK